MMTIKINEFITVSYTNATWQNMQKQEQERREREEYEDEKYEEWLREQEIDRENYKYLKKIEEKLRAAKNDDEFYAIYNDSCYSDIYKDVNGVRPHGMIEWFKTY